MPFCPLCQNTTSLFAQIKTRNYFQCSICNGIFLDPKNQLTSDQEKQRYQLHENDLQDAGYQDFLRPMVEIISKLLPATSQGLDFGSGPQPSLSQLLKAEEFSMNEYDPFFQPEQKALKQQYDFIICNEVIEHFKKPAQEFHLLKSLLKPKARLFCSTALYDEKINFANWYYKNDATHVFFYQEETLNWIQKNYKFQSVEIYSKRIIYFVNE